MRLCTVIGHVVASEKHPIMAGKKILIVDDGHEEALQLAVDGVGAGVGTRVLVAESGAAGAEVVGIESPPVRSVVTCIVDGEPA